MDERKSLEFQSAEAASLQKSIVPELRNEFYGILFRIPLRLFLQKLLYENKLTSWTHGSIRKLCFDVSAFIRSQSLASARWDSSVYFEEVATTISFHDKRVTMYPCTASIL